MSTWTTITLLLVLVFCGAFEGWALRSILANSARDRLVRFYKQREIVRQSRVDQQIKAIRAAHQLSIQTWKARQELYDLENQHAQRSDDGASR